MLALDPVCTVVGHRVVTTKRFPGIGSQVRLQRDILHPVAALETGTETARPVVLGIERDFGNTVILVIQINLLVDHLDLGFDGPVFRYGHRITGLQ
ncbi:hypothetical protein D3C71_2000380 [compost metagenome]